MPEQIDQRGPIVSIHGDIKKLVGHGGREPAASVCA